MQLIALGLGLAALLALALALASPVGAGATGFGTAVRSGAFSLAAVLVILLISRLITEFADALREWFMILYGFLLFYCIFWLLFILFLTVKYCWCRRKR